MKKTQDNTRINNSNMDIKPRLFPYTVLQLEDNHQEKEDTFDLNKLDEVQNINDEELVLNNNGNTNGREGKVVDSTQQPLEGSQSNSKGNEQTNNIDEEFKLQEIHVESPPNYPIGGSQKDSQDVISLGIQLSEFEQQIKADKSSSQKKLMDLKQLLKTFDNIKVIKKENNPNTMLLSLVEGFIKGRATRYLILQHNALLICEKESKKDTFRIRSVCPLSELFQIYNDKDSEHIRLYFINKMKTAQLLPRCKEFDVKNKQGFLMELREQIKLLGLDFQFQKL